jgi:hypothetical protein
MVGCPGKSSFRKVTYPSTIPAVGSLTSKFSWDPGEGLGFEPPLATQVHAGHHPMTASVVFYGCLRLWFIALILT